VKGAQGGDDSIHVLHLASLFLVEAAGGVVGGRRDMAL